MRIALLVVLLAACNGPQKKCEHARDAMAQLWTKLGNEALSSVAPDERAAMQKTMDAEHAQASGRFVELCVALPDSAAKCIARIDEIIAAEQQMRQARDKCARDENGLPDNKCEAAAEAKLGEMNAGCTEALKSFNDQLFAE